jgi:hypothetical protein
MFRVQNRYWFDFLFGSGPGKNICERMIDVVFYFIVLILKLEMDANDNLSVQMLFTLLIILYKD